jgi:DNA-binding protein YbaB
MTGPEREGLYRLHDEIDSLVQTLEAARADVARESTGSDDSGTVVVTTGAGGRVTGVRVTPGWRERVGAQGLGEAVLAAIQRAAIDWVSSVTAALDAQATLPAPKARPAPLPSEFPATQLDEFADRSLTGDQIRVSLNELTNLLSAVNADIDRLTARVATHLAADHTGHSRAGHVTVTVSGAGSPTGLQYDRRWLQTAPDDRICAETAEAFRAAYEKAGEQTVAGLIGEGPLAETLALANDPLELTRRLRLRTD